MICPRRSAVTDHPAHGQYVTYTNVMPEAGTCEELRYVYAVVIYYALAPLV